MKTVDDRIRSRIVKINLSLEILSHLECLLTTSKPLTEYQVRYCLMLRGNSRSLRRFFYATRIEIPRATQMAHIW